MKKRSYFRASLLGLILSSGWAIVPTLATAQTLNLEQTPNSTEAVSSTATPTTETTEAVLSTVSTTEPTAETEALAQSEEIAETQAAEAAPSQPPVGSETEPAEPVAQTAQQTQTVKILSPPSGATLPQPSSTVIVEYKVGQTVNLRVNGQLVDRSLIGRTETNSETGKVRETWYGVIFGAGGNTLTAHLDGSSEPATTVNLEVPGEPDRIKVSTRETRVPADGRSTVTVVGQLLDSRGNRSSWNSRVTLEASEGEFVSVDANSNAPGFQVEAVNGEFTAELQAGLQAGTLRIRASNGEMEGFHQLQMITPLRPSGLLAGVVDVRFGRRGTDFFDSFRDFLPPDGDNRFELDTQASGFATTSVGEWLFTGAFNTERPLNEDCRGESTLFRAQVDCDDTQYSVYGDNSTVESFASSTDNLYLRLERTSPVPNAGIDYVLWGDYNTNEFAQPSQFYTATNRALHGAKANYNLGNLQITGIFGNNTEGFQRDTIAPDGTSGFYFLSRRLLVPGSEQVYLELEELDRPGTVLERTRLLRGADYEIDYDRGTLLFRRPILRTDVTEDGRVAVRRIVTTYQFDGEGGGTSIYGGRLQYNFSRGLDKETWLGATYLLEDRGDQDFELFGADAYVSLGGDRYLIAEYAHSENGLDFSDAISGDAYRVELAGTIVDKVTGRAYFNHSDTGFSNTATTSFVPGQTRYGAEITAELSSSTSLRASIDHEDNKGIAPQPLDTFEDLIRPGFAPTPGVGVDNSLTTITAGIQQRIGRGTLGVDYVRRERSGDFSNVSSDQIRTSFITPLTRDLSFHAYNDLTLSSESDPVHPNRTTIGIDWQVHPGITVALNQSYFTGGQFDDEFLTSLDIKGEHTFSTDTTLRGEVSVLGDQGLVGRFGIDQGVTLAPGLEADFSYERVFSGFRDTAAGSQFAQPFAVGSGASALGLTSGNSFSAGLSYTDNPDFKAKARVEYRDSASQGSNLVITADALGRINNRFTTLASYSQASSANQTLSALGTSRDLKLGLAYRNPKDDRFNALLRYEYRDNPSLIPETILFGRGTGSTEHLLSAEAIYAPDWRWEFYGKFGLRHSRTNLAENLVGTSTVSLAQLRTTYRFDKRWDASIEGRWIGQPSAGFNEFGIVGEIGYYLNPNLRLGAGYVFGSASDRDLGNSRSASGPFFGITVKLDNNLLKDFGFRDQVAPKQQQESTVEASNKATEATPEALATDG
ncbi:MAG: TonB-dependent receptor [Cyanobacteria bacterium P01_A01_bin.17]